MNRREFIKGLAGAAALGFARSRAAQAAPQKPNFVIILADDLGYHDISCFGAQNIPTPNLDALAKGGLRFTDFYSNGAVCSPTRTALMTGRYQQRSAIEQVITAVVREGGLPPGSVTFASVLKAAGYATAICGKWHLGYDVKFNPTHYGFDYYRGYVSGNVDYISHYDQAGHADWWEGEKLVPEEGYSTHLITKHAVEFIEAHKGGPFCLYVPHECCHAPYQVPGDPPERGASGKQAGKSKAAEKYPVMIGEMDKGVGQVIAALERNGLRENTLVFFMSDNGGVRGNGDLRAGKSTLFEGGIRVPGIANWPGRIKPGRETDTPAITLDLMPTMLALAGTSAPPEWKLDGADLSPVLLEGKALPARALFWRTGMRAVREGEWKLVLQSKNAAPMLFNLKQDIGETKDLAAANPEKVRELSGKLEAWEASVDADGAKWLSLNGTVAGSAAGAEKGARKKARDTTKAKGEKKNRKKNA